MHAETAGFLLAIPAEQVDRGQRRAAMAVNFGALYGQQATGLVEYAFNEYDIALTEQAAVLRAIQLTHRRLLAAGVHGGLCATIHDELLCDVAEADAERPAASFRARCWRRLKPHSPGPHCRCCRGRCRAQRVRVETLTYSPVDVRKDPGGIGKSTTDKR